MNLCTCRGRGTCEWCRFRDANPSPEDIRVWPHARSALACDPAPEE